MRFFIDKSDSKGNIICKEEIKNILNNNLSDIEIDNKEYKQLFYMNGKIDYIVWIPILGFFYALLTSSLILLYKDFYKWHFVWLIIFLILNL